MALTRTRSKEKENQYKAKITWKEIKRQKVLLFWSGVMVIYGIIFYYLPLAGWAMAFQNYKPKLGIFHSEFVGLQKFQTLFSDMTFIRVIRNTLAMGVINLVVTFVTAIAFAILLNEIKSHGGKKVVQTISYLPHFLSWIIVTGILHDMLSGSGIINEILMNLHVITQPINFFAHPNYFWPIVAFANVWKETGWNAIMAGLNYAKGDILIGMDDDMQTHPSQLPYLFEELEKGYADMQAGRTKNAKKAFADIRKDYGL